MHTASQNIRYLRRKYQFTQEQMARKLGIKRSLLGAYEEARANPRLEVLVKAAELFNVSVDQLVSDPIGELHKEPAAKNMHTGSASQNRDFRTGLSRTGLSRTGLSRYSKETEEQKTVDTQRQGPFLPPRKIAFPSSDTKKSLQRLRLVPETAFKQYFFNALEEEYLKGLPEMILPLPSVADAKYRAFEVKDNAMQPICRGAIVVGRQIENIQQLKDGKSHILTTRTEGILFRRVFNHIEKSGNLLLEANHREYEPIHFSVLGREVEAWEVVLYISAEAPSQPIESEQSMDLPRLTSIVMGLQQEVMKLKEGMRSH
ncbi:XRE family transcriptional regulator [Catalinimonas niigatensis]|uniref:XRE family transcriptional regulator n=1 Tax=Catalinimonas niigatensis TaxID=1397264 RepID=UPI0026661B03|nr:helix-turn-helix transcriptional regulator [Catalinimonas niigatensis]WPP50618.1 helix-turn-helix transcriptional regulator [Catalinimonas niigatensis]